VVVLLGRAARVCVRAGAGSKLRPDRSRVLACRWLGGSAGPGGVGVLERVPSEHHAGPSAPISGAHWTELCPQGWSHHPYRMRAVCLYRARLPYPGHHPDRTKEDQAQGSAGPRRAYTGRSTLRRRRSFRTS